MKICKEEIVIKQTVIGCKCDVCGKEYEKEFKLLDVRHENWEKDLDETYKTLDVCSNECYVEGIKNILNDSDYKNYNGYVNSISIEQWNFILGIKEKEITLTDFFIDKIKDNNFSHTFNDGTKINFKYSGNK